MIAKCLICNKRFFYYPSQRKGKFCSYECYWKNKIGKPTWNKGLTKESDKRIVTNAKKSSETLKKLYKEGKLVPWNKGKKGVMPIPWAKGLNKKKSEKIRIMATKVSEKNKGKHYSPQTEFQKGYKWSKELEERRIRNMLKGLFKRPTSLEQKFIAFFNENNLPFTYCGNGSLLIGYKNPDFVESNGRKLCIEVANKAIRRIFDKLNQEEYEEKRIEHFAKYGWKCLVLWEDELKNKQKILEKIRGVLSE